MPNSAEACSGFSLSACSNASIACGYCLACAYAVPRKYQVSASFGSTSVTCLNAVNGRIGFIRVLRKQAEVVPGMRVLGILLGHFLQDRLGIIDFLQVEQRDGAIQLRNQQLRILCGGRLELLERLLEQLLVHVGDADVVQPRGFGNLGRGVPIGSTMRCGREKSGRQQDENSEKRNDGTIS